MAIKTYKPVTNGRRNMTSLTYEEITTNKPEKSLVAKKSKNGGRNNQGVIFVRDDYIITVSQKNNDIIKDIKTECAEQFKMIKDLCFINEYNNKNIKLKKIYEIASDNFSALVKDIVINETDETAKIIELPNTDQSK